MYRADSSIDQPGVTSIAMATPAAGADVTGRTQVSATTSGGYGEVTFAVSVDGAPYEVIGVDDNAPYRVYHDVSGIAPGTAVTYKAIVKNANGHLASDKVGAVVGEVAPPPPPGSGPEYAIVHYQRSDGDYGDHTTGDFNDMWGLHLWGEAIDPSEATDWPNPKPFLGEDDYGRFAWIKLADVSKPLNFIVHRGDTKDGTNADRSFDAAANPEVWLKQDDPNVYTSQAAAQGFVTIHYQRPDADYTGWGLHLWGDAIDPAEGTDWAAPKPPTGIDEYGAYWKVAVQDVTKPVNFIVHRGDEKDPGPDQSMVPADGASAWLQSGDTTIYASRGAAEDLATIHYHRADGDYGDVTSTDFTQFWGLHVWAGAAAPNPSWQQPVKPTGFDLFGPYWQIALQDAAPQLAHIIHRGDTKDPGPDMFLTFAEHGYEVWQLENADPESPYILPVPASAPVSHGDLGEERAHWVDADTIVWPGATDATLDYALCHAPDGGLVLDAAGIAGGQCVTLAPAGVFPAGVDGWRHLAGAPAFDLPASIAPDVAAILTGQVAVVSSAGGVRVDATGLQIPGVLDDLFATDAELGVTWAGDAPTVRLWAPTAKSVALRVFDDSTTTAFTSYDLTNESGVWTVTGDASWSGKFYLFEVEVYAPSTGQVETNLVTDPYSVSLSMNSTRSQIVDLDDPALMPDGWDDTDKPDLDRPEDVSIYELHVRDFSISDETVPAERARHVRGVHRRRLRRHGAPRRRSPTRASASCTCCRRSTSPPSNEDAVAAPGARRRARSPRPRPTPTSSRRSSPRPRRPTASTGATTRCTTRRPRAPTRPIPTGRSASSSSARWCSRSTTTGLRVVMDVVYNHTHAAGQDPQSVLDRIVPGYYHRLDEAGAVETSTCCANTASEHAMMEKLHDRLGGHLGQGVQGRRLPLRPDGPPLEAEPARPARRTRRAHARRRRRRRHVDLPLRRRLELRRGGEQRPLRAGHPAQHGRHRHRHLQRPAARRRPRRRPVRRRPVARHEPGLRQRPLVRPERRPLRRRRAGTSCCSSADQIRVGLAGNLADFEFVDRTGAVVTGSQVDYNGSPAGYTADPQENIVYVEAHDNQTLFDIGQYHHPLDTTMADRVRAQNVANAIVAFAQGVPFLHAGQDMLRSKSMDRNSFDSGDWFNQLDWSMQTNNWGVGLPPAAGNSGDWPLIGPRLADPALDPAPGDIRRNTDVTQEWFEIRTSSPLFRLETADDVQQRLTFGNTGPSQTPGLIVMSLSDAVAGAADLDPKYEGMQVLFNATDEAVTYTDASLAHAAIKLHPVLRRSADRVVRTASFAAATGTFTVPARTVAVFVDLGPDTTPPRAHAELDRIRRLGHDAGIFEVDARCTDDRPGVRLRATLNGVRVDDGDIVFLYEHHRRRTVGGHHVLFMWAPSFELKVTCTDAAGNISTDTARPRFGRH